MGERWKVRIGRYLKSFSPSPLPSRGGITLKESLRNMNITIKADCDDENIGKSEMTFSDASLDNDAFVNIWIGNGEVYTVSIHDLMPAVIAFECKRSKRLTEEEHML